MAIEPVTFGDLPRPRRGSRQLKLILDELRDRPGDWAFIGTSPSQPAANMRAINIRRKDGYESTIRGCDVWARYIGEQQQEAAS